MSDEIPPVVQPTPVQPTPPPVIVQPIDNSATHWQPPEIPKSYIRLAMVAVLIIGIVRGWLTPETLKPILEVITGTPWNNTQVSKDQDIKTVETKTVETKTVVTPPVEKSVEVPVHEPVQEPAKTSSFFDDAMKFIQSDQGKQVIQLITDVLKPKPPVDPVKPDPVKPDPVIIVKPDPVKPDPVIVNPPGNMKLVLTDSAGLPITSTSVPTGKIIRVMASNVSGDIGWTKAVHGNVEVSALPMNLGYDFVINDATSYIDITVFDTKLNKVEARVTANQAPQPPPVVVVDPVKPDPVKPDPVKPIDTALAGPVMAYIVYEVADATPDVTNILNATSWWRQVQTAGVKWAFFTMGTQNPTGLSALDFARGYKDKDGKAVKPPYLVVGSQTTGTLYAAMTVPTTLDEAKQIPSVILRESWPKLLE